MTSDKNCATGVSPESSGSVSPCFTPGTLIATPRGEVAVEALQTGDQVITRDNGIQDIVWTGDRELSWADLCAEPHLKPVMIRRGSLGNNLPERDMMVSPNHRILVANDRTAIRFNEPEVLVSAKNLMAGHKIFTMESSGVTYVHFMLASHQVVLSNGAWTETFQPSDFALKGLGNSQRNEIFEVFPDLRPEEGRRKVPPARRTLSRAEAMELRR